MDKEKLEHLSIFELREYARKIGVSGPTALKKNDLIRAILDVESGKIEPNVSSIKQGRPPKAWGRLVSIFLPADELEIPTKQQKEFEQSDNPLVFKSRLEKPEGVEDTVLYQGCLEELFNNEGLLRKKISLEEKPTERCYVREKTCAQYHLKGGDEIVCNAYFVAEDRPLLCADILSINGVSVKESVPFRENFEDLPVCYNDKLLKLEDHSLDKLKLKYGDTIFCYNDNVKDFINFAVSFANVNNNTFDHYIYLSPMSKGDKFDLLKGFPDELFLSSFQDTFENQKRTSFMAINRAKRLAEMGKHVCLIMQDILEITNLDSEDREGNFSISKSILASSKNLKKGSLTIMCGFKEIGLPYLEHKINSTFAVLETNGFYVGPKGIKE